MKKSPRVAVVGSLNVDQTLRVARIPAPGETVMAEGALTCFGGKGANQAVAAARAGGEVRMIGCVGPDDHGARYRDYLEREGIDCAGVLTSPEVPTGSAFITVEAGGENSIVVHPGANHELSEQHLDGLASLFEGMDVVLLQLECPLASVSRAAEIARAAGARVILNPSPWQDAAREIRFDVLIANHSEARAFAEPGSSEAELFPVEFWGDTFIVTRGAEPTRVRSTTEKEFKLRPPKVTPVDTVGAGDTFAGAFAVAHGEGQSLLESVRFANAAASLATLKPGAQAAIPRREEIEAALVHNSGS